MEVNDLIALRKFVAQMHAETANLLAKLDAELTAADPSYRYLGPSDVMKLGAPPPESSLVTEAPIGFDPNIGVFVAPTPSC